jgi:hypothetical protein
MSVPITCDPVGNRDFFIGIVDPDAKNKTIEIC